MARKPNVSSKAEQELDKAQAQLKVYEEQIKTLTLDRMNEAPKLEVEPQTKISQTDIAKSNEVYLKPERTISVADKFNEKFRSAYEFDKEYVNFIAENHEIKGETIELWTRPYGGMSAEFWKVPVNKPVWGPRYLAEQIKSKRYHRLVMQENMKTGSDSMATYNGAIVADTTINRLDAMPVSNRKSVFMGKSGI
jgi:hypothetical protein